MNGEHKDLQSCEERVWKLHSYLVTQTRATLDGDVNLSELQHLLHLFRQFISVRNLLCMQHNVSRWSYRDG